ncbi:MAG: hypothetical protein LBG72_10045 [Spirochaetaceae bacterium]|jgi:uncharacterized membrane protein YkvI|nr:hypothetical protein [Spirochaetaceae bacterium]
MAGKKSNKFQRLIVPGLIFQSIFIAGGYGTGRELAEFFFPYGSLGGLIAMCTVTLLSLSIVCAATFEFARVFKLYDYRSFFKKLIGPFWVLFEIAYLVVLLLVLAVCIAAAGSNLKGVFHVSRWIGVILLSAGVIFLILKGTEMLKNVMSFWSYVLYAVYILFMVLVFVHFGGAISEQLTVIKEIKPGWLVGGASYAFYNLACVVFFLFVAKDFESRGEALASGLIAGVIGIVPGIMLFLTMMIQYPAVVTAELPVNLVFDKLNAVANTRWLQVIFQIVLFGTFIETASGFIKAATDRLEGQFCTEANPRKWVRPVAVIIAVLLGIIVAQFGLIPLIAKGYGTMCWVFLIVYIVPLLTLGIYKIVKQGKTAA